MNIRYACSRGWRSGLFGLLATVLAGCTIAPEPGTLRIDRLVDPDEQTVELPMSWPKSPSTSTRLDAVFRLPHNPPPIAIYQANTTLAFRASVNGHFVYQSGDSSSPPINNSSYRSAVAFRVPAELLRPGDNQLTVQLYEPQGSYARWLGVFYVGEADAVERLAFRRWLAFHIGPMAIGVLLLAIGLVSLGLWAGRRDKDLFMLLATGSLLWALQIMLFQWPTPPLPSPHRSIALTAMYAWWPLLIAVFFLRFAYRSSRALERSAAALAIVAAPLLYTGWYYGWGWEASVAMRAGVLVFIGIGLTAILRYALQLRTGMGYVLLTASTIGVGVAFFDFFQTLTPSTDRVLVLNPYSSLSVVLLAGWMLLERYHRAYAEFEMLNRDLEQRVAVANVELRRRLEQVDAARAAAEQASVAKSRFFAAASHDLRQPLHSLGLFATVLRDVVGNAEGRDLVRRIGDSIAALDRLFDELLDISRLDAGTVEVRRRNVALQPLFDRLAEDYGAEAAARELRLRLRPTRLAVHTDPLLLERVLSNLVSNALRYTRTGGVLVGARRRSDRVLLQVWDSGIGIAADQHALIFDEFYQVSNPGRDRRKGLGLGLAIVRRLTTLLDTPLELRSAPERGTRFTLGLPQATGPVDAPEPDAAAERGAVFAGRTALIVDDDADICDATARLLAGWGFDARAAPHCAAARELLRAGFVPDVVLADLRLGEAIDGIGVVEQLRADLQRPLPTLLISGDLGARDMPRVKRSGLLLLTKPVAPARLRSALSSLLPPQAATSPPRPSPP